MARLFRRFGYGLFWVMSGYLALMLVIALSEQGQPTDDLAVSAQAPGLYPVWYQNAGLQNAAQIGVFVYPVAALALLLAAVLRGRAGQRAPVTAERLADWPAPEADVAAVAASAAPPRATGLSDPATLCRVDRLLVIRGIGAEAADLFGVSPTALIGQPLLPQVMPQDAPRLQQAVAAVHAEPTRPVLLEIHVHQPDGTVLKVRVECHPRQGAEGPETLLRLLPAAERGSLGDQLAAVWY
ncbi:PAS domain-containing protein [Acidisoma sp. 7E03]